MKTSHSLPQHRPHRILGVLAGFFLGALLPSAVQAQGFNAGSDGSLGDVVIGASTNIALPPDGILNYRSLQIASGVTVTFTRNARNTPVYILSQGDVVVNGSIDVSGSGRTANTGGAGGPGGFDGGNPGFGAETPPGNGYGPGGGEGGFRGCCDETDVAGGGAFATRRGDSNSGATYGNPFLLPMIGGSGGGGGGGAFGGGGGGGGAVLIAANTRIVVSGSIVANGGGRGNGFVINSGSGGAIRLVSMMVEGGGSLSVNDGGNAGLGRIRVDSIERSRLNFNFNGHPTSIGSNLLVFPPVQPTLSLTEVAGTPIAEGTIPGTIFLPFGSTTNRTVKLRAKDFGRSVNVRVTLTPDSGAKSFFDTTLDNTVANPVEKTVDVVIPVNTKVAVHAWTL
jgi:hypothetical protein